MKTRTKRWISAGLVATLVIAAIQFIPNLPRTSHAEGEIDYTVSGDVVRGVLDDISELETVYHYDKSALRGTATHPFIVLEVVPYLEYAEFGYLIGGCEPVAIESLEPKTMSNLHGLIGTMNTSDVYSFNGTMYYFEDEPEYAEWYSKMNNDSNYYIYISTNHQNNGVYGYYELVEDGKGDFLYTAPKDSDFEDTDSEDNNPEDTDPEDTVSGGDQTVSDGDQGSDNGNIPPLEDDDLSESPEDDDQSESSENDVLLEATIEKVAAGTGNMIWHTINELNLSYTQWDSELNMNKTVTLADYYNLYQGITFEDDYETAIKNSRLSVGDKLYTKRPIYYIWPESYSALAIQSNSNVQYAAYKNREHFLRYSVIPGSTQEQIDNYSVLVKTITPSELNDNPGWIDYADLISISPQQHAGGENYREIWDAYNRLGKSRTNTTGNYVENFEDDRDISWEVALKIYNKVTADYDFAALVMDSTTWNVPSPKKSVTVDVYNFNLQKKSTSVNTLNIEGSANNLFKLSCMLVCMDSYFFKQIYMNGKNPILQTGELDGKITGKISLQENGTDPNAAYYWLPESFLLAPDDIVNTDLAYYWNNSMWDNYGFCTYSGATNDGTSRSWCKGHLYAYKGNNSLAQGYVSMDVETNRQHFKDFAASLASDNAGAYTAEAIQYILGVRSNPDDPTYGQNMTLKVLDLEPSVDLNEDETPKYYLQPTYFLMLLPNFRGNLQVTHQTTAEFIGKIEDLNATYELIYIGLDISGYNTKVLSDGSLITDWNDNSLDGKIYIRKGDVALGDKYHDGWGNLSVDWLLDKDSKTRIESNEVRFAGNDISALKKAELEDYLNAGYPIVVDQRLYDADARASIVEANTYINQLMSEQIAQKKEVYGTADTNSLEEAVKKALGDDITFDETMPIRYDGTTKSPTSAEFANEYCYLPRNSSGEPYLSFKVNAKTTGYRYRVYVDLNRDSKFTNDEILNTTDGYLDVLHEGDNDITQKLPIDWVGLLQWKVEAYQVANPSVRYEMSGCSAVQLRNTGDQKDVSVLQIMPDQSDYMQGFLNLEESELFKKYYKELKDYKLSIKSITYSEYKEYFADKGFSYDYTKEAGDNNPVNLNDLDGNLMDYNMIIVGFGDCYAKTSITNEYGQLDFLRYFTDQGKSILYTHDLTTFYNEVSTDFSFYPTTRLRDTMGMNRYGSINYYFYKSFDEDDENEMEMREHLVNNSANVIYDSNGTNQTHGYTYFAIKRLGTNNSTGANYKLPYKYISGDYLKDHLNGLPGGTNSTNTFNFMNEITTVASKVNEGQITVYPYKIDDSLKVASTHGQYYQLNPEDENLTVWYCLAGDDHTSHGSGDGTSLSYAVSPNDTMNNYYIYSKGNIFYSGVGHIEVKEDMEAKLFINTMIAAFNAAAEPPKVEVTNPEATLVGTLKYDIELMQLYDFDASGELVGVGDSFDSSDYIVTFKPLDYNLTSNPKLECKIQWEDGTYVKEVIKVSDGSRYHAVEQADGSWVFKDGEALVRDVEYSLVYPAEYFSNYHWTNPETGESGNTIRTVSFTIKNDRVNKSTTTILDMSVQPLFPLD